MVVMFAKQKRAWISWSVTGAALALIVPLSCRPGFKIYVFCRLLSSSHQGNVAVQTVTFFFTYVAASW